MYDEIWVAGALGRERYAYAVSGVPASKVKEIGPIRPPAPEPRPAGPRPTVVYAPSWEQVADAADLDSLLAHGAQILEALLARQDVRTVFVPAAPTGSRVPAMQVAADRLCRRVAAPGDDSATWPPERLPEALAAASFAVVDVSPALAEAVRADVPFAVPSVRGLDAAAMHAEFPTTQAGFVLRRYPQDVLAALEDALGPDTHASARLALGRRLDASDEFTGRFRAAVDQAIAVQRRRRAFARPAA
jgi:hypothetical protein